MPTEVDDRLQPVNEDLLSPIVTLPNQVNESVQEDESGPDSTSKFDKRYREPFLGLLYIGELTEKVTLYGHDFILKTPTQKLRLETGLLHKKYLNSLSTEIAWAAITLAAYLQSVDGSAMPEGIGPRDSGLQERFDWVIENLKSSVIQDLFESCLLLDDKVEKTLSELKSVGEA